MTAITEIPLITIPVTHYRSNGVIRKEDVDFKVYRENNQFKAILLISEEQRLVTGLPKELLFVYANHCIVATDDMEDESLYAIKQIILELEAQELLWITK